MPDKKISDLTSAGTLTGAEQVPIVQSGSTVKTILSSIKTFILSGLKTSDLINDGDDGTSHFISLEDLPSTLALYPTTAASGIGGYNKLVSSITDLDYNTTAVDVSTGAITGTDQLIAGLITDANQIIGNPGIFNMTTVGNIRKTSGSGQAEFFFRVYKRDAGGTETLILQSNNTQQITSAIYAEFFTSGLWNDGVFISTDRIVIKFYGTKVGSGSNPTYDFQFGGTAPVRSLVPIPLTVAPSNSIQIISKDITDSSALTGTTTTTLMKSVLIPANTYATGDVVKLLNRAIRNTTTGTASNYFYINTTNSLTGATLVATQGGVFRFYSMERNLYIKSATVSETSAVSFSAINDSAISLAASNQNLNINWSVNQYIIAAFQNAAVGESTVMSSLIIQKF
jgi:hypothetical protein